MCICKYIVGTSISILSIQGKTVKADLQLLRFSGNIFIK